MLLADINQWCLVHHRWRQRRRSRWNPSVRTSSRPWATLLVMWALLLCVEQKDNDTLLCFDKSMVLCESHARLHS
jgi:hypothetical protein